MCESLILCYRRNLIGCFQQRMLSDYRLYGRLKIETNSLLLLQSLSLSLMDREVKCNNSPRESGLVLVIFLTNRTQQKCYCLTYKKVCSFHLGLLVSGSPELPCENSIYSETIYLEICFDRQYQLILAFWPSLSRCQT